MMKTMGDEYARRVKADGQQAAMRAFVDGRPALSGGPAPARDLRQAGGGRDQRRLHGRRLRTGARLPLSHRRRQRQDARRPAGDQGRPVSRRRRHAARPAADAERRKRLQMLLKGDQIRPAAAKKMGLVHDVAPLGRDRAAREGLGEGQSERQGAVGRSEIQAAVGQGVLARRHDDLAAGQRHLPPRDLRQLSRRESDPARPSSKGCSCRSTSGLRSRASISPRSCFRRKPRR